ncbi:MAG: NAD(P)-dependent oxidoreductase, partial [Caulobacter sp.]|nr:NAD(P)-dependent oxidoreductase [Caulobacter sp.]
MKTAFIGLGVMGFPMAGHLKAAGHDVTVFNRSPGKAARWVERHGGVSAPTIAEAAAGAELVMLCVGNDDDVRDVVAQALPAMGEGGVIVDHTTTSATVAREMDAAARAVGRWFVDAPVSGGQAGAESGQLTIMAGGDAAAYARVEPVLAAYAKAIRLMGPSGAGQLTKMCNQIAIAGVVQGVAEALHFAKRAGLPTDDVLAAISKGAAQSWQMENRWKTMSEGKFDFGFAVDWMRKDL